MNSVLILGNPNSGKSLLFNRLTGLSQKVANFPGVTVEVRSGEGLGLLFRDFPGIYSLQPLTRDEVVAVDSFKQAMREPGTRAILYVVDATRLERSLYLLLQVLPEAEAHDCPVVVALNVIDELFAKGAKINQRGLAEALGAPVVAISARTQLGLPELKSLLAAIPERATAAAEGTPGTVINAVSELRERAARLAREFGPRGDVLLVGQNRLDAFFLSTFWGPLAFLSVMLFLFQSIFSWAAPVMDFIARTISQTGGWVAGHLPPGVLADFVKDALFEGVGSFLVFAPQIFILFVIIGMLEDSGYLARATILLHRPLSWFGLSGRSFVPLLSGHACAIPAIMATRTIESPRKRLLTILAIPFMSCSARLPVYAVLIAGFVPAVPLIGRLLTLQGLTFFGLYVLGIVSGVLVTALISQVLDRLPAAKKPQDAPFVIELPPYRVPNFRPILRQSISRTVGFVKNAGGMIFSVTVVIWFLGYFPHGAGHLDTSWLGHAGRWIDGIFQPMGMDWKIGVAVLTSFLAREVFVGTLGTLYGIENATDNIQTLSTTLQTSGMTAATAVALMVFFALSMQCVSTLAVIRKETGSRALPAAVFAGMSVIAYAAAMAAYHIFR